MDLITDYITGKKMADTGAEMHRQALERYLVENRGYAHGDVGVDVPFSFPVEDEVYHATVDLLISVEGRPLMAVKCAAGSLGSREREILAAARLALDTQIPYACASDGKTAIVMDTLSGKKIGEGLDRIPSRKEALALLSQGAPQPLTENRRRKERLIFRSYDSMNVNVRRNI